MAGPRRRPRARRRHRAVASLKGTWRYPVCYLTHRKGLHAEDLIDAVTTAIEAAGGSSDQWTRAAYGEAEDCTTEDYRKLLLLAHKFVEIR